MMLLEVEKGGKMSTRFQNTYPLCKVRGKVGFHQITIRRNPYIYEIVLHYRCSCRMQRATAFGGIISV